MKLFKKTILALMAVAVSAGFSACSDDDDYTEATNQEGAFFAADAAQTIGVPRGDTSFDIDIYRTDGSQHTYKLQVTDPKDMFEVPEEVIFAGQDHKTKITVNIKGEMQDETDYPLEIKIVDGSGVGLIDYKFNVRIAKTVVTATVGKGTYIFNAWYTGGMRGIPVTSWSTKEEPNYVIWTIGNPKNADEMLANRYTIEVTFDDFSEEVDGVKLCRVYPQYMWDYDDKRVMLADWASFREANGYPANNYIYDNYYDPESGLLQLNLIFFIDGTTSYYAEGVEHFQFDGFPDYSVSVEYKGLYIDPAQTTQAIGVFSTGNDVAKVAAAAVQTNDPEVALDYVLEGGSDVIEFEGGDEITKMFPVNGAGDYIIMAVTYDEKGEAMELDYDSFTITSSIEDPNKGWTNIGQADFYDGWITAAFAIDGVSLNVEDYAFTVEIQQNDENHQLFRMVEPWGSDYFLASKNNYPAKRNIEFWLETEIGFVTMLPQQSGFGVASWGGELVVGDLMGMVADENPDATHEAIATYTLNKYKNEFLTTYEDGIMTYPLPLFGAPKIQDGTFGYNWQAQQHSVIFMPDVPESVKAKVKAQRVAAPKFTGLYQAMRAERLIKDEKIHVVKQLNPNKSYERPRIRK